MPVETQRPAPVAETASVPAPEPKPAAKTFEQLFADLPPTPPEITGTTTVPATSN